MELQFLGATNTVTGSRTLVRTGRATVLVDCGLFQGYKQLRLRNWSPPPVDPATIDAVVLTHAHIDHSGYLPLLARNGFRGPVYASAPTRDLCRIMLPDSGGLQEEEADFHNRHKTSKHQPALPLYTRADAVHCLQQFRALRWHVPTEVAPGVTVTLSRAGHMPGASSVLLSNGRTSVLFSGDVGRRADVLLLPPEPPPAADYIIVESTYGDRLHPATNVLEQLAAVVNRTAARGGTLVIPAFAVGRAQALMHCLRVLKDRGAIHHLPVYLNSPMAADALDVFRRHGTELRLTPAEVDALCDSATVVASPDESRALNARRGPMVIIAGSGMATGGRVVHHIAAFAPRRQNTILLAGFQAGGTRGASLVAGAKTVRIHGQDVPVRAQVAQLDGLSGHADAQELQDWLAACPAPPRRIFINHGEPGPADALRQRIERHLGWTVHMPDYLETVAL